MTWNRRGEESSAASTAALKLEGNRDDEEMDLLQLFQLFIIMIVMMMI